MTNNKKKTQELKNKVIKTKNIFEEMTGRPTSFKFEGKEGTFVYDEKSGKFFKENSDNQWMVDNSKQWMADNPSEKKGEHVVMGVKASPNGVSTYSQKFQDGELVAEGRDEAKLGVGNKEKRTIKFDESDEDDVEMGEEKNSSNKERKVANSEIATNNNNNKTNGAENAAIVGGGITLLAGAGALLYSKSKKNKPLSK